MLRNSLVLFVLTAALSVCAAEPVRHKPFLPPAYTLQFTHVVPQVHEDLLLKEVVVADEGVGILASVKTGSARVELLCVPVTEREGYNCYLFYPIADPIRCFKSFHAARSIYELSVIDAPPSDLKYLRTDLVDGELIDVWHSDTHGMFWNVGRDTGYPAAWYTDMPTVPVSSINMFHRSLFISKDMLQTPSFVCQDTPSVVTVYSSLVTHMRNVPMPAHTQLEQQQLRQQQRLPLFHTAYNRPTSDELTLPDTFDARDKWPSFIRPATLHSNCTSSWAHTTASMSGDRFSIATNTSTQFSVQYLLSCDLTANGCLGGESLEPLVYVRDNGLVLHECMPDDESGNGRVPVCPRVCKDGRAYTRYNLVDVFKVSTQQDIMFEIFTYGPLRADIDMYSDLHEYKDGVYVPGNDVFAMGTTSLKLIGWGKENGIDYWLAVSAFGTTWGKGGTMKIKRGDNTCRVEEFVVGGHAPKSHDDNGCNYNICQNKASCTHLGGQEITCNCPFPFTGKYCATWRDPCEKQPCGEHGTCQTAIGSLSFNCSCDPLWIGPVCSISSCGKYEPTTGYAEPFCDGTSFDSRCHVKCDIGYRGKGGDVTCTPQGWTRASGCRPVQCGEPVVPNEYHIKSCSGHAYTDSCLLTCDDSVSGAGCEIFCTPLGQWSEINGCNRVTVSEQEFYGLLLGGACLVIVVGLFAFWVGTHKRRALPFAPLLDHDDEEEEVIYQSSLVPTGGVDSGVQVSVGRSVNDTVSP